MGCFSYLCEECGEPIKSDSFSGEHVHLFLLRGGKVIEKMDGQYDSYGRVFDEKMESVHWKMDWLDICDLDCSWDKSEGIAVIHTDCISSSTRIPTTKSDPDPEQGWGKYKHSKRGKHYEF